VGGDESINPGHGSLPAAELAQLLNDYRDAALGDERPPHDQSQKSRRRTGIAHPRGKAKPEPSSPKSRPYRRNRGNSRWDIPSLLFDYTLYYAAWVVFMIATGHGNLSNFVAGLFLTGLVTIALRFIRF